MTGDSRIVRPLARALLVTAFAWTPACALAVSFDEYQPRTWAVQGTVTGLGDAKLVLLINDQRLEVGDGPFKSKRFAEGTTYLLTLVAQPPRRRCTIAGGEGTLSGGDIEGVAVKCVVTGM